MTVPRRTLALVMSLLVLQLTLAAGGGYACERPDPAHGDSHAGMVMTLQSGSGPASQARETPPCEASDLGECGLPSGTECRVMTPCATMLFAQGVPAPFSSVAQADTPLAVVLAPPTTSRAPELPPPRA
jgi:hypothetical protein